MKLFKIVFISLILCMVIYAQHQINYSYGQQTDGTWYTESGYQNADSSTTIEIVFDLQDYMFVDFKPLVVTSSDTINLAAGGDSVQAGVVTVYGTTNYLYIGTFWYMIDAAASADSSRYYIEAYPGGRYYEVNDGDRIETSDIKWSTTAVTLADSSSSAYKTKGDIQWTGLNVYLSTDKMLPPEIFKIKMGHSHNALDSLSTSDWYWNFAYPAVPELYQQERTTRQSDKANRKPDESLH